MKDLLPYCKYYHGEEECPFDFHDFSILNQMRISFWEAEKQLIDECQIDPEIFRNYLKLAEHNYRGVRKEMPLEKRAVFYFVCDMIEKWDPYHQSLLTTY